MMHVTIHRAPTRDVKGQRFGMLTALYPTSKRKWRNVVWHCRCDCGGTRDTTLNNLVQGLVRSCACLRKNCGHPMNEAGKTYGFLTVLDRAPDPQHRVALWRCRCCCGREVVVPGK